MLWVRLLTLHECRAVLLDCVKTSLRPRSLMNVEVQGATLLAGYALQAVMRIIGENQLTKPSNMSAHTWSVRREDD